MLDVFSGPVSSVTGAPDLQPDYVLIDGGKRTDAERWLYELFDNPIYRNLFDGTAWAAMRQAAPILVCVEPRHPNLGSLLAHLKERECGYAMTSDESLDTVANHLRQFIEAGHPLGYRVLLRFSDPAVARVLLAPPEDGGLVEVWTTIAGVMLPDALWNGWHLKQRPEWTENRTSQVAAQPRPLSELTLNQLEAVDRRATLLKLVQHLETCFPDSCASRPRSDVVISLRGLMDGAIRNGYTSLQALTHWCSVFGYLGHPDGWARVAPEVDQIFQQRPAETGGAEARQAALLAREMAQTTHSGRA